MAAQEGGKFRTLASIGESFKPDPDTRKLYYAYLLIPALILAVIISSASTAILLYVEYPRSLVPVSALVVPYLVAVVFVAYWIPRYLSTVSYTLSEDRVIFVGGLWWKRKSFVPYNRITNIDLQQGPLSRRFGLGKVSIQTAGYSGQAGGPRFAEIAIFGVKEFEGIKDAIMSMIVRSRPVAIEAGVETVHRTSDTEILEELRRIRKGIEVLSEEEKD